MPTLAPGKALGPYTIVESIGSGAMGEVFRAHDTRIGRHVAVKVLTAAGAQDPTFLQRFEQESRAAGMLNHPNLLTIYDVGTTDGAPYIVSELLEGETLRERIDGRPLTPRQAIDFAMQIAQGLAAAHEKGIVHRDLKPENLFITREGRLKILDFGIAKLSVRDGAETSSAQSPTEPGMIIGTIGYMSPEQVRGETVDHRSDIFAFGTILYEMLAGGRPFRRDTSIETMSAILTEDPPDLTEVSPTVPPALERIVQHCLAKNREQRFQSARDLAFNLESLAGLPLGGMTAGGTAARAMGTGTAALDGTSGGGRGAAGRSPGPTTRTAAMQRPTVIRTSAARQRPTRRQVASRALVATLAALVVFAAGYAVSSYAKLQHDALEGAEFRRMTFRRGEIGSAKFTPDGGTIIYSAAWDGMPAELFTKRRENPESSPLGIRDAAVLAISATSEMAILLGRDRLRGLGTLARVPLVGGRPRPVLDDVLDADWSRDGNLAVIHRFEGKYRIEHPIGNVLYETVHFIHDLQLSPAGDQIAFIEPIKGEYHISVLPVVPAGGPAEKPQTLASGWKKGASGLAWSADGKEIWFTGTNSDSPPALHAITLSGATRLVTRMTGQLKLNDIAKNGSMLLTNSVWRATISCLAPGEATERDLTWYDWSIADDLSPDGTQILFSELREGGGASGSVYLRRTDGSPPLRLADGSGDALSPDGAWALAHNAQSKLVLLPTGTGQAREVKAPGAFAHGADWFPDGKRILIAGAQPKGEYGLHVLDLENEETLPLSPEGIWGDAIHPFSVSPDGRYVAGMNRDRRVTLYSPDGGEEISVPMAELEEIPIQWSPDSASLYVYRPTEVPAKVYRLDFATGSRELWREFKPADAAGLNRVGPIFMTSDASAYVYNSLRALSDLYVVEGLR